jgi:hypothetical protein
LTMTGAASFRGPFRNAIISFSGAKTCVGIKLVQL